MIYLVFGDQEKAIEMMQGLYRDNEGNIIDADLKPTEDYRNRVVGTMNEFREKLMILDKQYTLVTGVGEMGGYHASIFLGRLFSSFGLSDKIE